MNLEKILSPVFLGCTNTFCRRFLNRFPFFWQSIYLKRPLNARAKWRPAVCGVVHQYYRLTNNGSLLTVTGRSLYHLKMRGDTLSSGEKHRANRITGDCCSSIVLSGHDVILRGAAERSVAFIVPRSKSLPSEALRGSVAERLFPSVSFVGLGFRFPRLTKSMCLGVC